MEKKKILLQGEGVREIMKKYAVSKATAYRAVKKGYFVENYHKRGVSGKLDLPERKETPWYAVEISNEDRQMSLSQLSEKFSISESCAIATRKRGWFIRKGNGRRTNFLPEGVPVGISLEDVRNDAKVGAARAAKRRVDEPTFNDAVSAALTRLLEKTADANFVNQNWRRAVARMTALDYLEKEFFKREKREEKIEDFPFETIDFGYISNDFSNIENETVLAQIRLSISENKWEILWEWANSESQKMTKAVSLIIDEIKQIFQSPEEVL